MKARIAAVASFGRIMRAKRLPALLVFAAAAAGATDLDLREAARTGDRDAVARLLETGADPGVPGADGTTALHWAVYRDDAATVELLVSAGAAVDAANRNGATALSLACGNGNGELVARLVAAGADPAVASSGEPPLLTCSRTGSVAAVSALLDSGADPNAREEWRGQTALMWAAAEDHAPIVKLLLGRGSELDARSTGGGFTALTFAARHGALESARVLIDAGADVDAITANGATVLHVAVQNRHYTLASLLLDHDACPNVPDQAGDTVLHSLVRAREPTSRQRPPDTTDPLDSLAMMSALFAHGSDPNARSGPKPWLTDAMVPSAIRPIIDNQVNLGGATPFLLAARAADVEAMRLLLRHGADPRLTADGNTTPLMVAAGVVFVEGSTVARPESDALAAVELALEAGVDVNAVNSVGQTALHGAVYRASNTIIQKLVSAGARLELADERGRTPLRLAEEGFNQVASVIRRERAAALLRELAASSTAVAR